MLRVAPFIKRIGELKCKHHCSLRLAELFLTEMKENLDDSEILEKLLTSDVVLDAASRGVFEIVDLCLKYFPELLWNNDFVEKLDKEILEGRHVELFRLLRGRYPVQCFAEEDPSKTIVRSNAVIKWSPRCVSPDVSGAAFLLQRELQWFQVSTPYLFASFLRSSIDIYIDRRPLFL